jgi:hypothetical protein
MNRFMPVLVASALIVSGCATLNDRDRFVLQRQGISGPVYEKMLHHEPLSLDDIIYLSQRGVPGPYIVHYLRPTYAVYKLSAGDVVRLQRAGVSEGVIRYLAATAPMFSPQSQPLWYQDDPYFYGDTPRLHRGYHRY